MTAFRPIAPYHTRSRTTVTVCALIARVVFHLDSLLLCLHFLLSLYWPLSSRFSRSCRDYLRQLPPFSFVLCLVVVWAFFPLLLAGTDPHFWSPPRGSSKYFISVAYPDPLRCPTDHSDAYHNRISFFRSRTLTAQSTVAFFHFTLYTHLSNVQRITDRPIVMSAYPVSHYISLPFMTPLIAPFVCTSIPIATDCSSTHRSLSLLLSTLQYCDSTSD